MKFIPYDPRDILYKSPFGAVKTDEQLTIRLLLHRDALVSEVFFLLREDNGDYRHIKMDYSGDYDENYRWYSSIFTPHTEGIYFYKFRFTSEYGEKYITRYDFSEGIIGTDGAEWQLTVYKEAPGLSGYAGGIIYQIFPDRFYPSGTKKQNVPEDRLLRDDWGGMPNFLQTGEKTDLGNDYFGGDLKGIEEKLDYIKSLGVTIIYLNPIFEAHSNHRYNTADYMKIDPLLGDEKDFESLCKKAKKKGIKIVFDGVFSHTGADSKYFNLYGRYGTEGAVRDENSPYRSWFNFYNYPDKYSCWWGVPSLPETRENAPAFTEFITGDNGVIRYWMEKGASGIRLDVADELPDEFIININKCVKSYDKNALIIGEVWEDASNKISYGYRRKYLLGGQLDSVMNYPFADWIIRFVLGGDGFKFMDNLLTICENYPKEHLNLLMNHIGTHDTARVLTLLAKHGDIPYNRADQATLNLSDEEYENAKKLLKLAAVLQYTLPGIPSLYYGDEAGLTGGKDPFCRGCYPWGNEDTELLEFYRELGKVRRNSDAFSGDFKPVFAGLGLLAYERIGDKDSLLIAVNRWQEEDTLILPKEYENGTVLFGGEIEGDRLKLSPFGFSIIKK